MIEQLDLTYVCEDSDDRVTQATRAYDTLDLTAVTIDVILSRIQAMLEIAGYDVAGLKLAFIEKEINNG